MAEKREHPQSVRRRRLWLALILGLYLLLTLAYGVVNPLFEAPDEHHHFFTVTYIANTGRLPQANSSDAGPARQEAAQPPLYYWLGALLIGSIDTAEAEAHLWPNPYVQLGNAATPDNPNAFIHTEWEAWPWRDAALAAHLLRAFSAVLGLGTLWGIYASGRLLFPKQTRIALLAVALVAFLPQFNFLHSAISNDPLIILLSTLGLWQLLCLWRLGFTRLRLLALGITLGLAVLAKTAGLLLLALAGLALLGFIFWPQRSQRKKRRFLSSVRSVAQVLFWVGLPVLLLAGWFWWRNWQLYGDVTAVNQFITLAGGNRQYSVAQVLAELDRVWLSFFAFFGWMTVRPPAWVYGVWTILVLAGVAGHLSRLKGALPEKPQRRQAHREILFQLKRSLAKRRGILLLLGGWVVLVFAGWFRFMMQTSADQGRLLFPALLPLSLAAAVGLSRWRWLPPLAAGLALATSLYGITAVIPQTYARPAIVTEAEIPAAATRLHADVGAGLELVAAHLETVAVHPGEPVWLTLYWRAHQVPEQAPTLVVELLGRQLASVGKLHTYHGGGLYPASLWAPGEIVVERLSVQTSTERVTSVPTLIRPYVKLLDESISVPVGQLKAIPETWPALQTAVLAHLGEGISLTRAELRTKAAQPGETITVHLQWQVELPPGRDLTTFLHLGDPNEPPLTQADGPPLGGDYPTSAWAAGEVIGDVISLQLPYSLESGRYPIHVGFYDPATGSRLPVHVDGQRQPHDAYFVGWLVVP